MKTNKKPLSIVERAKKSFVGKIVCRLMGEEKGAVMMEYVIVAVLIAAAVAVAAWVFGRGVFTGFQTGDAAVRGDVDSAQKIRDESVNEAPTMHKNASDSNKKFINAPVTEGSTTTDSL